MEKIRRIKNTKKILLLMLLLLVGLKAFSQADCDELAMKYDSLKNVLVRDYTQPLDFVEDFYSFYNRDYIYKDVKIRKHSENRYIISLIEKSKLNGMPDWSAEIYYLTIEEDSYSMAMWPFTFDNILEETVNQGNKTDETGDQGSEEGQLDERALYGKPGGSGGSSLERSNSR